MSCVIIPDSVPENHSIRSHLPMASKWLTIHETANKSRGANAAMHGRYMCGQDAINREVLWHFTVDDKEIRQHLPVNEAGWHAGDGYDGPGNRQSIGIELCVNEDGDFAATQRNAAALVAHLIATVPTLLPFPDCTVQHNRWSGKDCPHQIRATPGGWDAFLGLCGLEMAPPVPAWSPQAEVDRLLKRGIITTPREADAPVKWWELATVANRILDHIEPK